MLAGSISPASCRGDRRDDALSFETGTVAPRGSFVYLVGRSGKEAPGRGLFLDVASGRRVPVPSAPDLRSLAFAADGSHVAWLEKESRLVTRDLSAPDGAAHELHLEATNPSALASSPNGDRVAVLDATRLLVADAATGRTLLSAPLPDRIPRALVFVAPGRVRLYPTQRYEAAKEEAPRTDTILELDLATGALRETGKVVAAANFPGLTLRPSASGERLLSLERRRTLITLRDGATGEAIAALPTGAPERVDLFGSSPPGKLRAAAFLAGGRIAAILHAEQGSVLRVYSPDGGLAFSSPLEEKAGLAAILGEAAPGILVVAVGSKENVRDVHVLAVDLSTGKIRNRASALSPLDPMAF
ncbi:MAG TPA: hypothetical protein VGR00_00165, partial [Thermoanaerobaculia bacterium]|nr:hypothetical protein [Thermoanaerobaculia bacterium]